ncbi:exodeoxyribonuclease VII large subunit [Mesorhizobium xinjiangense]|uniref:exodeoxyribonuclease VII large subunit n=1 Tax=Mesorhizobium xinjiangense TaxID=2678685 RepID=UPI0012ED33B3|nr:exodeoxyribonuclease VII large subunit [Mesorhizobium xinjiangense]
MSQRSDSPTNAAEFTVSEISVALKRTVEDTYGNVRVRGEISGYRGPHSSGHAYFALKDDRARLEAVIWRGTFSRLKVRPEEGMEVIASGKLTTYPGSSKYQIVIDTIEPAGAGALMALLEERKRRLAAEGLFEQARKRRLPYMPRVIGVVTSPTGAVIRDIIHRISDRFPLHVVVWPVRVQGETAGEEVAAAVAGFNAFAADGPVPRPDVLVVARGGGSLEDLWGFNDEAVVRAVAASSIPVISAVGHETDWTLIDLAADVRAPTPTGAAEIAVPVKAELEAGLANLAARLGGAVSRSGDRKRQALRAAARALPSADQLLALPRRRFDEAASRLGRGLIANLEGKRLRLGGLRLTPASIARRIDMARRDVSRLSERLPNAHAALRRERRHRLDRVTAGLSIEPLQRRLTNAGDRLANASRRGDRATTIRLERLGDRLAQSVRLLDTLSYHSVLERGFALVHDASGAPVKRAAALSAGDAVSLEFADGRAGAVIAGDGGGKEKPRSRPQKQPEPGKQGSLF